MMKLQKPTSHPVGAVESFLELLVNMRHEEKFSIVLCCSVFVSVYDAASQSQGVIKRDLFWNMLLYAPIENRQEAKKAQFKEGGSILES